MANYYLSNNGGDRQGPFPEEDLVRNGMTPNSLVWCNGMPGWAKASEVPALAVYLAAQSQYQQPQYPQPGYGQPQYPQPSYGQPQYPQYAQGQYGQPGEIPPRPNNNLVWAILVTLFCCWPLGIVAIIKASKVNGLYNSGDYNGANEAAEAAKKYSIWSAVLGFIISIIYGIIMASQM